jgi:hypothetical protein
MNRFTCKQHTFEVAGTAATATAAYVIPAGYAGKILHGSWSHNCGDGARTGYWVLTRDAASYVLHEPASLVANTRRQLYTDVVAQEPLLVRFGDTIALVTTAVCDAGKLITIQLTIEEIQGETL